jgi:hypothetical protein
MVTGQKGQQTIDNVILEEIRKSDAVTVESKQYETELLYFKRSLVDWWMKKKNNDTKRNNDTKKPHKVVAGSQD